MSSNTSVESFRKTFKSFGKIFQNPLAAMVFRILFSGVGKQLGSIFLKTDGEFNGHCFPYLVTKGASSAQCIRHTAV